MSLEIDDRRLAELAVQTVSVPSFTGSEEPMAELMRDVLRAGDDATPFALVHRPHVDDEQIGVGPHLVGRVPRDPGAGLGEHVVYPRNCGSTFSPNSRICS